MTSRSFTGLRCKACGSENLTVLNPNSIYKWKTGTTTGLIVARCKDCYWNSTFACEPEEKDDDQEVAEENLAPSGGSGEPDALLAPGERGEKPREADTQPIPAEKAVKKTALLVRNECPSKPGLWTIGG